MEIQLYNIEASDLIITASSDLKRSGIGAVVAVATCLLCDES